MKADDPKYWRQQDEYALRYARKFGWSPWHGWHGDLVPASGQTLASRATLTLQRQL
jgi:hypothetical protein